MVRLKAAKVEVTAPEVVFQFLNGTIKRACLEHVSKRHQDVSIPKWYD